MAGEGGWDEAGAAGFGDKRLKNTLPLYGNKDSMNINSMILTNIIGSPYFKEELIAYKTFHEVVDEIFYKVDHLEPWEKNSRKLAGQVGMCAGLTTLNFVEMCMPETVKVRGVAAGGIVSTAFCLLFKLFTFKLTRKQVTSMINHRDSPYIRGIGFIYIRYCQPPADFWGWFSPYFDDEEEIDLKAGGGYSVTIGEMCQMMLSKLDWFGTLFPRLPVNVQKDLESKLKEVKMATIAARSEQMARNGEVGQSGPTANNDGWGEAGRRALEENRSSRRSSPNNRERRGSLSGNQLRSRSRDRRISPRIRDHSRDRRRPRSRDRRRSLSGERLRSRSMDRHRRSRSRERRRSRSVDRRRRSRSAEKRRSHSKERRRSRSHSRDRGRRVRKSHSRDKRSQSKDRRRSRSRSTDRRGPDRSSKRRGHSKERRR